MILKVYPENPSEKNIQTVVKTLEQGGIIIIPTDSVYGMACDITKPKAIEKIAKMKGLTPKTAKFALIFEDISTLSDYVKPMDGNTFKLLKKNLPGPFTFILNAAGKVPKMFSNKKKTIGVRIPANTILRAIVKELGHPIMTTSVIDPDDVIEYTTDPSLIHERYENQVELVLDGGYGKNIPTALIDLTNNAPEIIREGAEPLK